MTDRFSKGCGTRVYMDGVEIDKIPDLAEVCKMDNWLEGFFEWLARNRPKEAKFDAIFTGLDDHKVLKELWVGGAPPLRAQQVGGELRRFCRAISTPDDYSSN